MNIFAIIVAILLNMVIGMIWYSALFGKIWATAIGFDPKELHAGARHYMGALSVAAVTVIATAMLVHLFHLTTLTEAITAGVLIWAGFIATNHFSAVIWAGKSLLVYFIDVGFLFVTTLVNIILLTLWV